MMFSLSILVQPLSAQEKEKLIMDGTAVIGNSEMPNVLYIVPWKKTPQPNLNPELHESLIESQLLPVDRNVFLKRIENHQRYQ
jgi:hypothetical protein